MNINRRKFIQSTSLGLIGSFIPLTSSAKVFDALLPPPTLQQRLKIAADFRKEGRINRAINKFTQIIQDYPSEIRGYDGLRKSLLQRKFKELEVLQLYETGLAYNPNSKDFKQRLAKEYMRLILGNKKFTDQYNSPDNLLIRARDFFRDLKNDYPERTDYLELFRKAKRKINQQADTLDARANSDIKIYKKNQRQQFKRRFNNKTNSEVEVKLNQLLAKPITDHRKTHIKELYRILIKRHKVNPDKTQAFIYALALFNFDKTDPTSLKKAKRFAVKTQNYDDLVTISQENHTLQNTFWSKLGLFDAKLKRYNKTGFGSLTALYQLLNELESEFSIPQQSIEIKSRIVRLALKQQNLVTAKQHLIDLGSMLSGTENVHSAVRFNVLVARYYIKESNYNKGVQVIKGTLGQSTISETSDLLLQSSAEVIQHIVIEKQAHTNRLNQVLQRLYNRQNI